MQIFTTSKTRFWNTPVKQCLLLLVFAMSFFGASAQVPANDECVNAATLTAGTVCTYQTFTNVDATASAGPAPSCGNFTDADVWFKVVVPASGAISVDTRNIILTDGAMSIYSGTCTALVELGCADDGSVNPGMPLLSAVGAPGSTLYIRFWGFGGEVGAFGICVRAIPAPPANDNCQGAFPLTVNPDYLCGAVTAGTTEQATASPTTPQPTCFPTGANDDVWFTFVATNTSHRVSLLNQTGTTDMIMQFYTGTTCADLTTVFCSDPETANLTGLIVGNTYWVRVYTWSTTPTVFGGFNICVGTPPPPPPNNNCATPVDLTVNQTLACTATTNATTESATLSPEPIGTACGAAGGNNDDIWFSFTATATSHRITLTNVLPAGTAMTMVVYSGTCAALTQVGCGPSTNTLNLNSLTVNQVYLVRVFTNVATATTTASFTICVASFPAPPANDECAGAIALVPDNTLNCTTNTAGTTISATLSSNPPSTACSPAGNNDDVWYSFVASGPLHRITLSNVTGDVTAMTIVAYSGTCGTLTELSCVNGNVLNLGGLTALNTYFIRVYTAVGTAQTYASFNICVGTFPAPPANDNCGGAIPVPVNPDNLCGQTVAGTTYSATQSTTPTNPSCGAANGWNDDVWFKFVASGPVHRVSLLNIAGDVTAMTIVVYGGDCTAPIEIPGGCLQGNLLNLTGLVALNTYYVRVYTNTAAALQFATFNICIGTPPPPPVNDEPCTAIFLTTNPTTCNYQTFTNESANASVGIPAPGCANYIGGDVWFKVKVPADGNIAVDTQIGTMTDGGMAFYSGTCSALTLIECDADDSPNGLMPMIERKCATGLTPGDTIWVRMWEQGNDNNGTFGICSRTPPTQAGPLQTAAPCNNAAPSCTGSTYNFPSVTGQPSGAGGGVYGCLGTTPNAVFYYFQIQTPGTLNFNISQVNGAGQGTDVDFALWGPFTSLGAGCTTLTGVCPPGPVACGYSTASVEPVTVTNTQVGQFYILLITNFSTQPGTITFNQTGGTGTTNCNIVCSATASNSGPVCPSGTFNLSSSTSATGATYSWTGPGGFTSNVQNPTGVVAPAAIGSYVYTVTVTLGANTCTGSTTVVVANNAAVTLTSAPATINQTGCTGVAITNITYSIAGASGASVTGLPPGVTGAYLNGVYTISGTPTATGTYNYTVTTTGGCPTGVATSMGTITVSAGSTLVLSSAAATASQIVCINTAITNIVYTAGSGATAASATGLPAGVTGSYSAGTFTISGTPTVGGIFNYTVSTTGGCGIATQTGTLTVRVATLVLTSAAATASQTVCINSPVTNIVYTAGNGATGATVTGLPAGVTGAYANGVFTISGTPTATGVFNYTVTATGCGTASLTGTITVSTNATLTLSSAANTTDQTVCINSPMINITYTVGGGGTGATVTGLPAGVTGVYAGGTFTISGSPTATGTFPYTVSATGGCGTANQSGAITVSPASTLSLTSGPATTTQTVCINTAIANIVYSSANGATGASVTGLPAGVSGVSTGNTFTISGTPTVSGTFNYTVSTSGGCGVATQSGTITVSVASTLTLSSAASTANQSVCINTAITNITYTGGTGVTGASSTGLPTGVSGGFSGGVYTISGTPTVAGTYNYTVTTTGGCGTASQAGTITVTTTSTLVLSSAPSTTAQTLCANTPVAVITYTAGSGATGATVTGLPAGVTGSFSGNVFTISGTPTATGTFSYTITTTGGCGAVIRTGTITVTSITVNAGPDQTIGLGATATLTGTATQGTSVLWTANPAPGNITNPTSLITTVSPTATTTYTLTATDPAGLCPAVNDAVVITVFTTCIDVKNAFSPNGDGTNDTWRVYDQYACLQNVKVGIYNRYGNKVYESANYRNDWNGTYKGQPIPDGTYYAVVEFTLTNGTKQYARTDVTVLR